MNTHDLPPAAKLAALIEAGRAANPDLKQNKGELLRRGRACAMGFAALAAGAAREELDWDLVGPDSDVTAKRLLGDLYELGRHSVIPMNDDDNKSIEEIIQSLREGELAKVSA
jgi:hypothetical protein